LGEASLGGMSRLNQILALVGVDTLLVFILAGRRVALWAVGISPALYRLGNGLANRRIAVFAKNENLESLRSLLVQSKLFKEKNIFGVTKKEDLDIARGASVYLMFWPDWQDCVNEILNIKPPSCALVVYAPLNSERIPESDMVNLDGKRHTAVTNFRGRLLNDIVTAMITTSYEKD
jgi:hypothetical protein